MQARLRRRECMSEVEETRSKCGMKCSFARTLRLVVVGPVPLELAHQIEQAILLSSCDELLQCLGHRGFFVRSPLTSSARLTNSGSMDSFVAMGGPPHG